MTYSVPISIDLEYMCDKKIIVRKGEFGAGALIIGHFTVIFYQN
jgi:hypothetical protein